MTNNLIAGNKKENRKYAFIAFGINLLIALIIFVPFLIYNKGLFTLSDDFNAQELAFNVFVNRELKELDVFFNWAIDIGSDFVTAFSFYNLGTPFFWITLFFKPETFPYLIGWILILKYAVAGFTSYLWLSRYTGKKAAVVGSVLYAFSGFQHMNMIFYHFHDVVAFFPLLLIGLEERVDNNKKGIFAATVAINALVNWNFFIGEVIFVILFYLIRYDIFSRLKRKEIKEVFAQILTLLGEGVLGVGVSAVLFIPSAYAMISNPRVSEHMYLKDAVIWSTEDALRILKGILLPPESMNHNSVLSDMNWYSVNLYLPMIGGVFVVVYLIRNRTKKDWLRNMLISCLIITAIPILNNIFVLFYREQYRRWYYMFILILSLASAKIVNELVEKEKTDKKMIRQICFVAISFLCTIGILWLILYTWRWERDGQTAVLDSARWIKTALMGIAGLAVLTVFMLLFRKSKVLFSSLMIGISAWAIMTGVSSVIQYRDMSEFDSKETADLLINTASEMESDTLPYRYGILYEQGYFNLGMTHSLTSINSFTSTVDPGITEFYDQLGVGRHTLTLAGPPGTDRLLSLKYLIDIQSPQKVNSMENVIGTYDNGSDTVYLMEATNTLPIGFTYDSYMTRSEFISIPGSSRALAMLNVLVVEDEDAKKVSGILRHANPGLYKMREGSVVPLIDQFRGEYSIRSSFGRDYFETTIVSPREKYAFYSVPYSERWSATVNGRPVEILNINGLMAVPVKAGVNEVHFDYSCRINILSMIISIVSALILAAVIIVGKIQYKKDHRSGKSDLIA